MGGKASSFHSADYAGVALRESEEKYRILFDSMNEGFSICDVINDNNGNPIDFRFLEVNKAYEEQTGLKSENIIGKTLLEVAPDIETSWIDMLADVAVTGRQAIMTDYNRSTKKYYETITFLPQNGKVALLLKDVTVSKQAEVALRESEQRYRHLFENMLNGFAYCQMLFDREGHPDDFVYLAVNEAFERLTGLTDVIGKRVTQLLPQTKETNPELFEIYGRVASMGNPEKFEIYFKPLDLYLSISVYCPNKGFFVAIFEDITELKLTEQALRIVLQRQQSLGELTSMLLKAEDPQVALDNICRHAMMYLKCDVFSSHIMEAEKGGLRLFASAGIPADEKESIERLAHGNSIAEEAMRTGRLVVVEHISSSADGMAALAQSLGYKSFACNPMQWGGEVVGTLSFGSRTRETFEEGSLEYPAAFRQGRRGPRRILFCPSSAPCRSV